MTVSNSWPKGQSSISGTQQEASIDLDRGKKFSVAMTGKKVEPKKMGIYDEKKPVFHELDQKKKKN